MAAFHRTEVLATGREPRPSSLANKHLWDSLQPPFLFVATLPHIFNKSGGSAASSPVLAQVVIIKIP